MMTGRGRRAPALRRSAQRRRCGSFAHLRAASHQRVRIDHGAVADPRSRVNVHRRHTNDALADVAAVANAGASGHQRIPSEGPSRFTGHVALSNIGCRTGSTRHVHNRAHAQPREDAFLNPDVDAPAAGRGCVRLGGADGAAVESVFKSCEQLEIFFGECSWLFLKQLLDLSLRMRAPGATRVRGRRTSRQPRSSRGSLRKEESWAIATPAPAGPSWPWRLSPESGWTRRNSLP